jgi:hypothetical protein
MNQSIGIGIFVLLIIFVIRYSIFLWKNESKKDKKYVQYEHHGKMVWVRKDLKGKHRDYCLCFNCKKLNLEIRKKNCTDANKLYDYCVKNNKTTPVFECEIFEQKDN